MLNQLPALPRVGKPLTRRKFIWLTSMSAAGLVAGCATNPVTGKSQLMLMSENQEISMDKKYSPHQFSKDYGPVQDKALNRYLQQTGKKMAARTHRRDCVVWSGRTHEHLLCPLLCRGVPNRHALLYVRYESVQPKKRVVGL